MTLLAHMFPCYLSRGDALLLRAILMSAYGFRQFLDFALIDNEVLKLDSHKYTVQNGIRTPRAL